MTAIFRCSFCNYREEREVDTTKSRFVTVYPSATGHIPGSWQGRWPGEDETLCYGALWRDEPKQEEED